MKKLFLVDLTISCRKCLVHTYITISLFKTYRPCSHWGSCQENSWAQWQWERGWTKKLMGHLMNINNCNCLNMNVPNREILLKTGHFWTRFKLSLDIWNLWDWRRRIRKSKRMSKNLTNCLSCQSKGGNDKSYLIQTTDVFWKLLAHEIPKNCF